MDKNKIKYNIKWWKFSRYITKTKYGKTIFIPDPQSKYEEYNPWEVNDLKKDRKYSIPMYGELIESLDTKKYFSLDREVFSKEITSSEKKKLEKELASMKSFFIDQILEFINNYGLLGIFFNMLNQVKYSVFLQPQFAIKKLDFSEKKNNNNYSFLFYSDLSIDSQVTRSLELREIRNYLKDTKKNKSSELNFLQQFDSNTKIRNDFVLKGFTASQRILRSSVGTTIMNTTRVILNEEGNKFFKNLNKNEIRKFYNDMVPIDPKYLDYRFRPGFYLNTFPRLLTGINYINSFIGSLEIMTPQQKKIVKDIELIGQDFFIPFKHPIYFESLDNMSAGRTFPRFFNEKEAAAMTVSSYYIDDNDKEITDIDIKKKYYESFDDFLFFINTIKNSYKSEEDSKKLNENTYDNPFFDRTNPLNTLLEKNINHSDYTNKTNPYSFKSPSLAGMIANMVLWDLIEGNGMKVCGYCKHWFYGKSNKLWCSSRCQQNGRYLERKNIKLIPAQTKPKKKSIKKIL